MSKLACVCMLNSGCKVFTVNVRVTLFCFGVILDFGISRLYKYPHRDCWNISQAAGLHSGKNFIILRNFSRILMLNTVELHFSFRNEVPSTHGSLSCLIFLKFLQVFEGCQQLLSVLCENFMKVFTRNLKD